MPTGGDGVVDDDFDETDDDDFDVLEDSLIIFQVLASLGHACCP